MLVFVVKIRSQEIQKNVGSNLDITVKFLMTHVDRVLVENDSTGRLVSNLS